MPFVPADAPVTVRRVDDRRWALVDPLVYEGAHETWHVPAGFVTDFASVPPGLTWLVPTTGRYTPAAIVHDYLLVEALPAGLIASRDIDGVFRRIMRELGVQPARRYLMWVGVRWGAAVSTARRPGWWRDAPAVVGLSVLAAPFLLPGLIGATFGWAVYRLVEFCACATARES